MTDLKKDKIIIFDCFGTLLQIPENNAYPNLIKKTKADKNLFVNDLMITMNFDWMEILKNDENPNEIITEFNKDLEYENSIITPYPQTLNILNKLRKKFHIVLLSNLSEGYIPSIEKNLRSHMDFIYYSCEIGKKKPNIDCFIHVIEDLENKIGKINRESVFLVDDKVKNISAFNKTGGTGFLIHTKSDDASIKKANDIVDFFNLVSED